MEPKPVVMSGASADASHIASFTREEWIKHNLKLHTFELHPADIRAKMLGQFYDLAVKLYPDLFPEKKKPAKK